MKTTVKNAAWSVLAGIAVVGGMLGGATPSVAQEAMMLERIGAVRMASPNEIPSSRPQPTSAAPTFDAAAEPMMLERIGAVRMGRSEAIDTAAVTPTDANLHLWHSSAHATAYYAIRAANRELTVTIEPGPAGGDHATIRRPLAEGHVERVTLSQAKDDRLAVTLAVTRHGEAYEVAVTTQVAKSAGF